LERVLLPGVAEKCAELRAAGITLAIASNQNAARDIADIHAQLAWTAEAIGASVVLYATDEARRKPAPTMLFEAMAAVGATPGETLFVGDRDADAEAAQAAGVAFCYADEFFRPGR
jgi:HAD superfamily hydrolase (TIGR01662 family)